MLAHRRNHDFHSRNGSKLAQIPCGNVRRERQNEIIRGALRGVWPSLAALLVASVAICAAAVVPIVVAPGVNPIAAIFAAIVCGPFLAALAAVTNEITFDSQATIRSWAGALRRLAGFGLSTALVPAVPTVLLLAAIEVWRVTTSPLVLPSVVVSGIVTTVAVLGLTAALPLGAARPQLRGRALWVAAVSVVAIRPVRFVAVVSAVGFVVWTSTAWSASLLLFLPAPAAIVAVTATWTALASVPPSDPLRS